jgi:hypothetical protein
MNVEIGTEAAHFLLWEYKNGIFVAVLVIRINLTNLAKDI